MAELINKHYRILIFSRPSVTQASTISAEDWKKIGEQGDFELDFIFSCLN